MLKLSDYDDALNFICDEIDKLPKYMQPYSFYRAGNIKSPGISDLDLIFSFEDNFRYGQQFINLFVNITKKIKNNEIFFLHLPLIYPNSSLKELPYFSFNPVQELNFIFGKKIFKENIEIPNSQVLLRSMEFIHARIIDLLTQIYTKKISDKNILVVGHSFLHSFNALVKINPELNLNLNQFKTFCKIEDFRKRITLGNKVSIGETECEELYKGICVEFYFILRFFYDQIQKKIAFHWSKNFDIYKYQEKIILKNLSKRSKDLHIDYKNNFYEIDGFSWEMKALSDNYYLDEKEYKTIFFDNQFKEEILKRKIFLKSLFNFNMINFGNAYGRSTFRTFAMGSVLDYMSLKM